MENGAIILSQKQKQEMSKMKYPIKGIPESRVIKNVEMDEYFLYVSYLTGEKAFLSKQDKQKIFEIYMRQINFFVNNGYSLKTNTFMVRIPSLSIAAGVAGSIMADPIASITATGVGVATGLTGFFLDKKALKESQKKHQVVRDNMQAFCAEYKTIRDVLGKQGKRKIEQPEDIIFAIDDMPKQLIYRIGKGYNIG